MITQEDIDAMKDGIGVNASQSFPGVSTGYGETKELKNEDIRAFGLEKDSHSVRNELSTSIEHLERDIELLKSVVVKQQDSKDEFKRQLAAEKALADQIGAQLKVAEAALSDIGDADREEGDDLKWCERRAAKAIPSTRAALAAYRKARGL